MTVYIEYVIIDNFVFDYVLLLLTLKSKAKEIVKRRVVLSASFGTFFAIIFPLLSFNEIILFGLKILIAFCMIAIADKFDDFRDYFLKVNKFLFLTFSFGGIIYGFMSLVGLKYDFLYTTTNSVIPLGIMIICAITLYFVFVNFFKKLFEKKLILPFTCRCVLFFDGQKLATTGFIDTGNNLIYDGEEGVNIADSRLVNELMICGFFERLPYGYITVNTVSGVSNVKIYQIDRLEIYFGNKRNTFYKVKIGIPEKAFVLSEEYKLILSPEYIDVSR